MASPPRPGDFSPKFFGGKRWNYYSSASSPAYAKIHANELRQAGVRVGVLGSALYVPDDLDSDARIALGYDPPRNNNPMGRYKGHRTLTTAGVHTLFLPSGPKTFTGVGAREQMHKYVDQLPLPMKTNRRFVVGDKRDFPKIGLSIDGKYSVTTWFPTVKLAVEHFRAKYPGSHIQGWKERKNGQSLRMNPKKTPFHVYAEDGFESAHQTQAAAEKAARRGAKLRGSTYRVVKTSVYGLTGGEHGHTVAEFSGGDRRKNGQSLRMNGKFSVTAAHDSAFKAGFRAGQAALIRKPTLSHLDAVQAYRKVSNQHGSFWIDGYDAAIDSSRGAYAEPGPRLAKKYALVKNGQSLRMNPKLTPFHVYAEDGFESAHQTQAAAEKAAKRGAKLRGSTYKVVKTSVYGLTGSDHGHTVAEFPDSRRKKNGQSLRMNHHIAVGTPVLANGHIARVVKQHPKDYYTIKYVDTGALQTVRGSTLNKK